MNKILNSKLRNFIFLRDGEAHTSVRKLSDMYTSRSTNYASCLNQPPFIIITDKDEIARNGYSKLCRAIITVDSTHPLVQEVIDELKAEQLKRDNSSYKRWHDDQLVKMEARTITIDEQFREALLWASEATGNEKSERCASAMKGLLSRNNIELVKSDFWKVFRILKARA